MAGRRGGQGEKLEGEKGGCIGLEGGGRSGGGMKGRKGGFANGGKGNDQGEERNG